MARQIALTQGYSATIDDADYDWLNEFRWRVFLTDKRGPYARTNLQRDGHRAGWGQQ